MPPSRTTPRGLQRPQRLTIISYGLRNPFRFTIRPGTDELWVGDVGWNEWEEITRISNPLGAVENFGWLLLRATIVSPGYDGANLSLCENLYGQPGADTKPYHAYHHNNKVTTDACPTGSSIAGWSSSSARPAPIPPSTTTPCSSPTTRATASG